MSDEGTPASNRRQYTRPPIQEVVIQVILEPGSLDNAAVPGQLYERVRREYPVDVQTEVQVQVPVAPSDPASAGVPALRQIARHVFNDDSMCKKLILTGETLSANALPPYEGWEALRDRFDRAASALFDARAELCARTLSIRYINRIVIPEILINTDDYFTIPVQTAEEGTAPFSAFSIKVQSVLTDDPIECIVTFNSAGQSVDGLTYIVDIEMSRPVEPTIGRVPADWVSLLEDLHRRENLEFESIITDRCRRLFEDE